MPQCQSCPVHTMCRHAKGLKAHRLLKRE
jgi:hypothetical protein